MTTTVKTKNQKLSGEELISILSSSPLLPQIIREIIIDQAISEIEYTQEEFATFYHNCLQINNQQKNLESVALRQFKIYKFKQLHWGNQVEAYFISKKRNLDRVSFSIIQINNGETAQEIYFRIQEGEESFADLAKQYSQGSEAKNGGWVGTFKLGNLRPQLAEIIRKIQPGEISPLAYLEKMFIIVRLEKIFPAQLNEQMREELLQEMFADWLELQVANYGDYLDLSTIPASNYLNQNSAQITDINPEINTSVSTKIEDDDVNESPTSSPKYIYPIEHKWKNLQIVTIPLMCLLIGVWGGFYLSELLPAYSRNLAPKTVKDDAFYDAINQATQAANLTQTAKSPVEWKQVSQSWINAIALLSSLSETHPQFTLATQKIQEYERNLNYARKHTQKIQNSFRIAVNHATTAANLTQTANSREDWEIVIKNWQDAIAFMKTVEPENPNYFTAQQKTLEYQHNVNYALSVIKQKYPESYLMTGI